MAEMTIRLQIDPATGKKDIVVSLKSEEDSLPQEHEQLHRQLVEQLMEGGVLSAGEAGKLIVQREEEGQVSGGPLSSAEEESRQAQGEGG